MSLLTSCAAGVAFTAADLTPASAPNQRPIVTLQSQVDLQLDTGYNRSLKSGSQWMRIGAVAQGDVYKPYNAVFTLEGAHVHEAWLVAAGDRLVGFYLPVERGFAPLQQPVSLQFSSTPTKKE